MCPPNRRSCFALSPHIHTYTIFLTKPGDYPGADHAGSRGAPHCVPPAPLGPTHHIHRAHQGIHSFLALLLPSVFVYVSTVCSLCFLSVESMEMVLKFYWRPNISLCFSPFPRAFLLSPWVCLPSPGHTYGHQARTHTRPHMHTHTFPPSPFLPFSCTHACTLITLSLAHARDVLSANEDPKATDTQTHTPTHHTHRTRDTGSGSTGLCTARPRSRTCLSLCGRT